MWTSEVRGEIVGTALTWNGVARVEDGVVRDIDTDSGRMALSPVGMETVAPGEIVCEEVDWRVRCPVFDFI
jgi:hypothetical protein